MKTLAVVFIFSVASLVAVLADEAQDREDHEKWVEFKVDKHSYIDNYMSYSDNVVNVIMTVSVALMTNKTFCLRVSDCAR